MNTGNARSARRGPETADDEAKGAETGSTDAKNCSKARYEKNSIKEENERDLRPGISGEIYANRLLGGGSQNHTDKLKKTIKTCDVWPRDTVLTGI
jgi:hypothetical protein